MGRVSAFGTVGKFVQVEFPQEDGTRLTEPRDHRAVLACHILEDARGCCRRRPLDGVQVFDADRHTVQGAK